MTNKTPIETMLDDVEWRAIETGEAATGLHATHVGVLKIGDFCELRVYQLSDGRRVIDADDFKKFFDEDD